MGCVTGLCIDRAGLWGDVSAERARPEVDALKKDIFDYFEKLKRMGWFRLKGLLILWDAFSAFASYFLALWVRFDFTFTDIPGDYLERYLSFIGIYAVLLVALFGVFRLYRNVWRYAGADVMVRIVCACAISGLMHTALICLLFGNMPRSYYVIGMVFQTALVSVVRFSYRFYRAIVTRIRPDKDDVSRVMIIGAGAAGQMLLRDLNESSRTDDRAVCMIDDDPMKQDRYIEGVPIVGGREKIISAVEHYHVDKIFLAIPSAPAENKRDILNICKQTKCKLMQVPGMYQLVSGQVTVNTMRNVSVEDLLGREPINADLSEVYEFISGKVVLVTGGGGSIGSELCRQIAAHKPGQLIIFDIYENNAYSIQLELKE